MSPELPAFRCSTASLTSGEPLVGSAPPDDDLLLVEHSGAWPAEAVRDGRLPEPVKAVMAEHNSYVIRRHGRTPESEVIRVFRWVGGELSATTTTYDALPALDLDALDPWPGQLIAVCTNGDRDRCCAEFGRPIAEALNGLWPDDVWEINHLGGHRFAGTLLHLPTGLVLGRLDPDSAVADVASIRDGDVPIDTCRGRMGLPRHAQAAEWAVRMATSLVGERQVRVARVDGDRVLVDAEEIRWEVVVRTARSEPFFQSCSMDKQKPAERLTVESCAPVAR